MTSTTSTMTPPAGDAGRAAATGAGTGPAIAALITEAPVPQPTLAKTFAAMMAREFRVLRRNAVGTFTRAVMQPLLFVFVFTYVMPKIGGGFMFGGASTAAGAAAASAAGAPASSVNFATILVPGLMAS